MTSMFQKALVYIGAATWFLVLTLMGIGVPEGFWRPLGIVAFVVFVVAAAYEKWIWAWLPEAMSGIPDLRGTWHGRMRSDWINPETDRSIPPIEVYFVIRQSASTIRVSMMTKESGSSTVAARLESGDGAHVVGVYRNESRPAVRDRSPIHYGGLRLHVGGPPATTLNGEYWTDRSTRGEIELKLGTRTHTNDFSTARRLCQAAKANAEAQDDATG